MNKENISIPENLSLKKCNSNESNKDKIVENIKKQPEKSSYQKLLDDEYKYNPFFLSF